jgi:3-dehydroquinate synthase
VRRIVPEGAAGPSVIAVGDSLSHLDAYCNAPPAVIITDAAVRRLHGMRFPVCEVIEIGMGEESKTLTTVGEVYEAFLRLGVDRSSQVVAIGGGIVCDVA